MVSCAAQPLGRHVAHPSQVLRGLHYSTISHGCSALALHAADLSKKSDARCTLHARLIWLMRGAGAPEAVDVGDRFTQRRVLRIASNIRRPACTLHAACAPDLATARRPRAGSGRCRRRPRAAPRRATRARC